MRNFLIICSIIALAFPITSSVHARGIMKVSQNIRRAGGDYTQFQTKSAKSCEQACMKSDKCRAFDYYMSDHSCWLKSKAYGGGAYRGAVSGVKINGRSSQSNTTARYSVELKMLQLRLNPLGYDAGTADGLMGKKTRQAIRQFQSTNGLPVTGKAEKQTMARLAQIAIDEQATVEASSTKPAYGETAPVRLPWQVELDEASDTVSLPATTQQDLQIDGTLNKSQPLPLEEEFAQ